MVRVDYETEDQAERDLDAYMKHYQGVDSSAAFNYGPDGVYVEYSHPWPLTNGVLSR